MVVSYIVLTFFVFMQTRHMTRFQGSNKRALAALMVYAFLGTSFALGILVFIAVKVSFLVALGLFCIGLVSTVVLGVVTAAIPDVMLSFLGFLAVPVAAFFLIRSIP